MQRSVVYIIYNIYLNFIPVPIPPWHLPLAEGINPSSSIAIERSICRVRPVSLCIESLFRGIILYDENHDSDAALKTYALSDISIISFDTR